MTNTAGFFVSFEGIDGSGKSTQSSLLVDALRATGQQVTYVREPGGTRLGQHIRCLVLGGDFPEATPTTDFLMLAADRAQLVHETILPALMHGHIVVADRYLDSTYAYQGAGQGVDVGFIDTVQCHITKGAYPNLTFLLDVDPAQSLARLHKPLDRFEVEDIEFFFRVRDCFLQRARMESDRVIVLDGTRRAQLLHEAVIARVLEGIKKACQS